MTDLPLKAFELFTSEVTFPFRLNFEINLNPFPPKTKTISPYASNLTFRPTLTDLIVRSEKLGAISNKDKHLVEEPPSEKLLSL